MSLVSHIYGMDLEAIGRLTMRQFNNLLSNVQYVMKDSKEFGKPPPVALPSLPITEYAARCGVIIPRGVHIDLIQKGEPE